MFLWLSTSWDLTNLKTACVSSSKTIIVKRKTRFASKEKRRGQPQFLRLLRLHLRELGMSEVLICKNVSLISSVLIKIIKQTVIIDYFVLCSNRRRPRLKWNLFGGRCRQRFRDGNNGGGDCLFLYRVNIVLGKIPLHFWLGFYNRFKLF